MARKTLVQLTDDIDGSEAAETVAFAIDGAQYEIDLSAGNAAALRESVARFVRHARKVSGGSAPRARTATGSAGYDPKAVRVWAAANGVELPARGRIPSAVLAQYRVAGN